MILIGPIQHQYKTGRATSVDLLCVTLCALWSAFQNPSPQRTLRLTENGHRGRSDFALCSSGRPHCSEGKLKSRRLCRTCSGHARYNQKQGTGHRTLFRGRRRRHTGL